jgi:polyphosphate glucokinase
VSPSAARRKPEVALGIDIGGTGVKAALVELATGELRSNKVRLRTPDPSTPEAVADTVRLVVEKIASQVELPTDLAVGCGLPGVVKQGRLTTAANIDKGWLEVSAEDVISAAIGRPVVIVNDADGAGIAEMRLGAGLDQHGTVLLLTIGTGIGSALFTDGRLVRNTELGHMRFRGEDAETRLSGTARERRGLKWTDWATEFDDYLARVEIILNPDLIILGGGVSKEMPKYVEYLRATAPIVAAHFLNTAGIVGAALHAAGTD